MNHIEPYFEALDKLAKTQPKFDEVVKKQGLRPGHVMAGLIVLAMLFLVLFQGYAIICALLTCVYPMIASIRAIESKDENDDKMWLSFWCIYGIFQTVEMFFGFILSYIPFYSWIRLGFFIYLMHPETQGAEVLYRRFFSPFLKAHQKEIEDIISKVQTGATAAATDAMKKGSELAKEHATAENMMKVSAAAKEVQDKIEVDTTAASDKKDE